MELGDCNQLSKLQINNSNNLKSLCLSFSKLTELPDGVKKLAHLQSLDLRGSNITKLPDSTNFAKSLRVLDLDDTENLTTLSGIQNFSNLRSLSICGSPQAVNNSPNALNNLKRLEYLYLKDNDLANLDINFSQLNNLKELIISENFLSNIPPSIQYLTHLEKLEANFNKFTSFPNTKLPQLKELELSSCQLHTFDIDATNFPMPKELTLDDNKLQSRPNLPTELTYLNISTNPLAQLPQNFEQLTQLKNIMMFETQINSLPENLGLLQALKKLDISDSPYLSVLPKSFGKLNALRELNILNTPNLFKNGFPLELTQLSALTSLDLSDCNISAIPNEISHLTKLENLSLDGSPSLAPQAKAIKKLLPKMCDLSID